MGRNESCTALQNKMLTNTEQKRHEGISLLSAFPLQESVDIPLHRLPTSTLMVCNRTRAQMGDRRCKMESSALNGCSRVQLTHCLPGVCDALATRPCRERVLERRCECLHCRANLLGDRPDCQAPENFSRTMPGTPPVSLRNAVILPSLTVCTVRGGT